MVVLRILLFSLGTAYVQMLKKEPDHLSNYTISLREVWLSGARSPLARRFVSLTILCSSLLAVLMTALQLTIGYVDDRSELYASVDKLEKSTLPALAESLWVIDIPVVQSQLDGIVQLEGMNYVKLNYDNETLHSGDEYKSYDSQHFFPVMKNDVDSPAELGLLTVNLSHESIKHRVLRRAWVVLITNFIKTAMVAGFVLLIYQLLIGRHLTQLADFTSAYVPNQPLKKLVLNRRQENAALEDEIGALSRVMNEQMQTIDNVIKKLRNTNRTQSDFTYALSHDLKSPINTIQMLVQELREIDNDMANEDRGVIYRDLDSTIIRMSNLIEDILTYSRSIDEAMTVEDVDLKSEIEEMIATALLAEVSSRKAEIVIGDLPKVIGNVVQLRLLFQNLISNAIKYCDADQSPVIIIDELPDENNGFFAIGVTDNGIGIEKRYQKRIFTLFKRLHTHAQCQGSGIGLSICQRVASNHGGSIKVVSKLGVGSTFMLSLPLTCRH